MRLFKSKNKLLVEVSAELIESLNLKSGDELEIVDANSRYIAVKKTGKSAREQAINRIKKSAWQIPEDYIFDREEANSR